MNTVPETYYQFIMDYAPYTYVIPPDTPDQEWGRSAFAAAFAINFLSEAYHAPQFENRKTEILNKITTLADFILTQQCTDNNKQAYGGFKSAENSTYYYTIDACRTIPALLKAYELTRNTTYHETALRAATFLYNMQQKPSQQGIHDKILRRLRKSHHNRRQLATPNGYRTPLRSYKPKTTMHCRPAKPKPIPNHDG
ncbi:hypothetical protein CW707_05560 [Candidatus Bathyarchaeota archaeon]|nr:MAG: hypothetical protein CW707_05560 [Candidatus Bathyarchaeota archaeon]